jgi:hypothetical protein
MVLVRTGGQGTPRASKGAHPQGIVDPVAPHVHGWPDALRRAAWRRTDWAGRRLIGHLCHVIPVLRAPAARLFGGGESVPSYVFVNVPARDPEHVDLAGAVPLRLDITDPGSVSAAAGVATDGSASRRRTGSPSTPSPPVPCAPKPRRGC